MYEVERAFYKAHQAEFREKYPDKELVIVGESLIGAYSTPQEALIEAGKRFKPGEFMIHSPAADGKSFRVGPNLRVAYAP